jgi:hypothetical protein
MVGRVKEGRGWGGRGGESRGGEGWKVWPPNFQSKLTPLLRGISLIPL